MNAKQVVNLIKKITTSSNFIVLGLRIATQILLLLLIAFASRSGSQDVMVIAVPLGFIGIWGLIDFGYAHGVVNDKDVSNVDYSLYWLIGSFFILFLLGIICLSLSFADYEIQGYESGFTLAVFIAVCGALGAINISKAKLAAAVSVHGYQFLVVSAIFFLVYFNFPPVSFLYLGICAWALLLFILWLIHCRPRFGFSLSFRTWWIALLNQSLIIVATQSDVIVLSSILSSNELLNYMSIARGVSLLYMLHVSVLGSYRNQFSDLVKNRGYLSYRDVAKKYFMVSSMIILIFSTLYFYGLEYFNSPSISAINSGISACVLLVFLYIVKISLDLWSMLFFLNNKLPFISKMALIQAVLSVVFLPFLGYYFRIPGVVGGMVVISILFLIVFRRRALATFNFSVSK